jgi:hypothetical protein
MTKEVAKKMLKAKLECLKNETSGINYDCNMRLCDGCSLNYEQGNMGEQKEALAMAIKALESQRWIPVSERLPEENGIYLATYDGEICGENEPFTGLAEYENGKWVDDEEDYQCVIAWMPLPEPYKEENNDADN